MKDDLRNQLFTVSFLNYLKQYSNTYLNLNSKHPFYIVVPCDNQGDIKASILYNLSSFLTWIGLESYIIPFDLQSDPDNTLPFYCRIPRLPFQSSVNEPRYLTKSDVSRHFNEKSLPIVIVPDMVEVPAGTPFIVRFHFDYPLKGDALKPERNEQYSIAYSSHAAKYYGIERILTVPSCDFDYFRSQTQNDRKYLCYYLYKSNDFKEKLPKNSIEISKDLIEDRNKLRDIFLSSKVLICDNNSFLTDIAISCGCNVVCLSKNGDPLPVSYYNNSRFAPQVLHSTDSLVIKECQNDDSYQYLSNSLVTFFKELVDFVSEVEAKADTCNYLSPIVLPYEFERIIRLDRDNASFDGMEGQKVVSSQQHNKSSKKKRFRHFIRNWILPPKITEFLKKFIK